MTIDFGRTSHMGGRLAVPVRLVDEATDGELSAHARTQQGESVPSYVIRGEEEGEWLVVLPALSTTVELAARATSWEGTNVGEGSLKISPIASRLGVSANPLRRRQSPGPDPDATAPLGVWAVRILRLVAAPDGNDICQGYAELVGAGRQAVEGALSVQLLDSRGQDAAVGEWTCLADELSQVAEHPGFFRRRVGFSVRVPQAVTSMVVWARPADGTDLPDGFASLAPREVMALREAWRSLATPAQDDDAYDAWFTTRHQATKAELAMQRETALDHQPLLSVVVAVREATPQMLRETVESVLAQSYERLELVLVSAGTVDRNLAATIRGLEIADARVRSVPLGADFGIAAAVSEGIDAAAGDFVCLLAEGDLLAPDALFCIAREISADGSVDLLYTDEDRIERGRHVRPQLKPDWDVDLLLGGNYVGGLLVMRRLLLAEMETMERSLDGAHGYHLALYAGARARVVRHVPRVLYHARTADGRRDGVSGSAASLAALRANLPELVGRGIARASSRVPSGFEVAFEVEGDPLVSVIVPNVDGVEALDRCLSSIRALTSHARYEVIVVEHGSVDPATFEYYRNAEAADERVRTVFLQGDEARDQARVWNFGASRAAGEYLLFLSRDTEVTDSSWMTRLLALCQREGTGASAARLLRPDGTVASCGLRLTPTGLVPDGCYRDAHDGGNLGVGLLMHGVTAATADCLLVDAEEFRRMGGVSEAFPGRHGDADLCLRLRKRGLGVVLDPQVTLVLHRALEDDGVPPTAADVRATCRLWESWPYGAAAVDPTGNPNLEQGSAYGRLGA